VRYAVYTIVSRDNLRRGVIKDRTNGETESPRTKSMNTNHPRHKDEALRALLKEWKATSSLPPGFYNQVWRRIERAEGESNTAVPLWTVWTNWIAAVLPRPALATAYVSVFLAIGATFGWAQARQETERVSGHLSAQYVRSVDPYQAPR
jgi:hypothetical protein